MLILIHTTGNMEKPERSLLVKLQISGVIKKDYKTKVLCKRLQPGDIALIAHFNIDEVAAQELIEKKVKAVINAHESLDAAFPAKGTQLLLENKILVIDNVGINGFTSIQNGEWVLIKENCIISETGNVFQGRVINFEMLEENNWFAEKNLVYQLDCFVQNTLEYARKEKDLILGKLEIPLLKTQIKGKHVLVVVRGKNYKNDLRAIKSYIKEVKPVLIGVDGGGDAICEMGFKPQIIVGDMDSVSDGTLKKTKDIIVHAYQNGDAPGFKRVNDIGLPVKTISAPGTSEDLALLLAYENRPELIVIVGSHSHMIDFLEKGRKGMGSTFLVRLKVGNKLVDARGLAQLYRSGIKWTYVSALLVAALFPILVMISLSPLVRHFFYLLSWRLGL